MTHSKIAQRNFDFPNIVRIHIHHCPSKNFTFSHQIQVCCSLVCSNERSIASCSTAIIKDSKIAQRNFDFPKVVHIKHCPHKYFTFSRQIQVYCSLVCSNERSIASCSKAIIKDSKIAQRNFDFPKVGHIKQFPRKYFTFSHKIQVCYVLVGLN